MSDTILLSGATGLVGSEVRARLEAGGRTVRALSRNPRPLAAGPTLEPVEWDGRQFPPAAVAGSAAVVHLAGEPIFGGPATAARKQRIYDSRIESTKDLVRALEACPAESRPRTLVCASAVGYYGDRGEERLEESAAPGSGFLADLCVAWEDEARRAEACGVRVVSLRFGVVLARSGGALAALGPLFRLGLGGRVGNGRQWFPWIHHRDAAGLVLHALDETSWTGAFNAVAPEAVRNADFTRVLASTVRRPALFPVPGFVLRTALGELSGELLGSRHVVPARTTSEGYAFALPSLAGALEIELVRGGAPSGPG